MADSEVCERIEEWAREAFESAGVELPEDASVSASAGSGGADRSDDGRRADSYVVRVELPEGEGQQQLASRVQSTLVEAVRDDPTLGGRFEEVSGSPAGMELVEIGEAGVRTAVDLVSWVTVETGGGESDPEEDERSDEDESDDSAEKDDPDDDEKDDSDSGDEKDDSNSDSDKSADDDEKSGEERSDDDRPDGEDDAARGEESDDDTDSADRRDSAD